MPYKKKRGGAIQWVGRIQKDGKIRQKVCQTKAEALSWEAEQRSADWSEPEPESPVILSALSWATEYMAFSTERFSEKTAGEKRDAFRRLFRVANPAGPVENVTVALALKALRARAGDSGYAANKDRKNLAAAWAWGVKFLDLPEKNPFKIVPRFAEERSPRYVPPEEDFWRAYEAAEEEQDRAFLLVMLHTAARRGEVIKLRWDDIDFRASKIRLWTRKRADGTLEADWIPMTSRLREALLRHRQGARSVFVFSRSNGQPYKWRQHLMRYLCGVAGVTYFSFHAIRHLTASILDREGVELTVIQAILRHKSATTTARYLHSLRGTKVVLDDVFGHEKSGHRSKPLPVTASK